MGSLKGLGPHHLLPQNAHQESMLDQAWARFRLDTFAPSPGPEALLKIGDLHYDLAPLLAEPAPLIKELQRQREILVELHDLGSRVDADLLRDALAKFRRHIPGPPFPPPLQEELDQKQAHAVRRRQGNNEVLTDPPAKPSVLERQIGIDPASGKMVSVVEDRFGARVTDGETTASVPEAGRDRALSF